MKLFKVIAIFFILALGCNSFGQHQNYLSINLHSQILNGSPSSIDMRVLVLSFGSDTVWLESHDGVTIESNETFFIPMGKGIQLKRTPNYTLILIDSNTHLQPLRKQIKLLIYNS